MQNSQALVNVLPSDKPQDAYKFCPELAMENVPPYAEAWINRK